MSEAYLAGRGLASALGPDLPSALAALAKGTPSLPRIEFSSGQSWPLYAMADGDTDWWAMSQRIVRRVAEESGAMASPRSGPLFIASSSLDIGALEIDVEQQGDYQAFSDRVAAWLDWRGPVFTVCTACTSAINALLSAASLIRSGMHDHALVLGLELPNRSTVGGFGAMQLLSPNAALPLGAAREGLVLGEAVAALHLSSQPARWRIAGGANVVDGSDPAGTVADAVVAMCREALANSGLAPGDIQLIKPQAAGSVVSDAVEVAALQQVFAPLPDLVSFKGVIGHTLGASGAAEIALLTACIESGAWPLTGYPVDSSLNVSLARSAPRDVRHVLASILGFGGGHAAIVLENMLEDRQASAT
jgi:3-oxoacyl-[acyl-carrier-protein] synthase-1